MRSARRAVTLLLPLLLIACGSAATAAQAVPSRPVPTSAASPSPRPTDPAQSPSAAPAATPIATAPPAPAPAPPEPLVVGFAGLAPGSYPVHLHRVCSGLQGYHLAYLPDLAVSADGSGGVVVPAAYFGQGWCLVVYANRAQTSVAAYRPI